jgi:hypothetical protein
VPHRRRGCNGRSGKFAILLRPPISSHAVVELAGVLSVTGELKAGLRLRLRSEFEQGTYVAPAHSMREIIVDLERTVLSAEGEEHYVQIAGEQRADGMWEAWLEFIPVDDSVEPMRTGVETTQPAREDVVRWSETLTDVYVQGAFTRAITAADRYVPVSYPAVTANDAPLDPFEVLQLGKAALSARLRGLTRPELLAIIEKYKLNPAGKDLSRLRDSQLVTFIVTAADVQALLGRH